MKCFQIFINVTLLIFKKKNFRLKKLILLFKNSIYFISFRNEHPVHTEFLLLKDYIDQLNKILFLSTSVGVFLRLAIRVAIALSTKAISETLWAGKGTG